jgi:alpha-galactosidase
MNLIFYRKGHKGITKGTKYFGLNSLRSLFLPFAFLVVIFFFSTAFAGEIVDLQQGKWLLKYDKATGDADYVYQGKTILEHVNSVAHLDKQTVSGKTYSGCTIEKSTVNDVYGTGVCYTVTRTKPDTPSLIQHFYLYDNKDYFLTDIEVSDLTEIASNYLCPVSTVRGYESSVLGTGDDRVLIIPFDNDKWVRYRSASLRGGVNSNEVTAVYNADTRNGIVIGSVEHNVWKSGIRVESDTPNHISRIEFYTGAAGEATRDVLPHGKVKGLRIRSPKVMFGYFRDWRNGMEEYGRACAAAAPPLTWNSGKPFGWNSWGKMAFQLTYEKILEVSDFFHNNLQNNHFENDSVVYIGMDAGWNKMSDEQLANIVRHCKANHQKAGIYFTPFSDWGKNPENEIEGAPGYKCKDAYLYANGHIQNSIAGGWAMDPTHPAIQQRIKYWADKFKKAGFEYVKLDFLTHGTLEADSFYDKNVTTGIQAFTIGMKYVSEQMKGMYITEAISPLFPAQYVHSRRIACDAWASMEDTEYTLNALTYGWWLNQVYTYNDPDYFLLESASDGENRARITSAAITGIMMCGDDFSQTSGLKEAADKAKRWMTNPGIMQMARECKSFRPVNGNTDVADFVFTYNTGKELYIAVFNYFGYDLTYDLPSSRLGLDENTAYNCKELWFGQSLQVKNKFHFEIPKKDVRVYRVYL